MRDKVIKSFSVLQLKSSSCILRNSELFFFSKNIFEIRNFIFVKNLESCFVKLLNFFVAYQ